jgi:DNA replication and repair protein RecF
MALRRLELENFRNITSRSIELSPKTIITGPNGSGKTTVLEAIRVISVGKSFRTSRLDELISFEKPYFRLKLNSTKHRYEFFYGSQFTENTVVEKQLQADGQPVRYMDFLGNLPSVSFSPSDIDIVTKEPSLRRQFIDGILWQAHPEFRYNQIEYGKVLRERSQLLFLLKINRASIDELQPWNELMTNLSKKIRQERQNFLKFAKNEITKLEKNTPGKIKVDLDWELADEDIEALQGEEIRLGHNLFGPHRDELKILCNDQLARRYASRGQARSTIALLKVIEAKYLEKYSETAPVILLDDVVSELDSDNINWLFSVYGDSYQLLATTIDKTRNFNGWAEVKI